MRFTFFILILSIIGYSGFSQKVTGIVKDLNTSLAVSGAHIYLKNFDKGGISDSAGNFQILVSPKINLDDTLIFSHIVYETKQMTFFEFKKLNFIIWLTPLKKEIAEVPVKAKKTAKNLINFKKITSLKSMQYAFGACKVGNKFFIIGGDESSSTNKADSRFNELYYANHNSPKAFFEWQMYGIRWPHVNYIGYNGDLRIYDTETDTWEIINSRFEERAYHTIHCYEGEIYVIGGKRISRNKRTEYLADKIEVYDIKQRTLQVDNVNPHQAVNFASVLYKDKIILLGGSVKSLKNGDKEYTSKVHLFNITTGYWYELDNMPQEKEINGILIKNKIYLVGGYNDKILNHIETYDLATNLWHAEAELFTGMYRPALAHHNNILYIFENGKLCTYNIHTKRLNEYKIGLYLNSTAMFYANDKLYILGGFLFGDYSIIPSSKVYSVSLTEFIDTKITNSKKF